MALLSAVWLTVVAESLMVAGVGECSASPQAPSRPRDSIDLVFMATGANGEVILVSPFAQNGTSARVLTCDVNGVAGSDHPMDGSQAAGGGVND